MADYISKNSAIQSLLADNRDSISEATTLLLLNKFYIYDRDDDGKEAAEEISLKNVLKSQNENREAGRFAPSRSIYKTTNCNKRYIQIYSIYGPMPHVSCPVYGMLRRGLNDDNQVSYSCSVR